MAAPRNRHLFFVAATALIATAAMMAGCARPGSELKAPCAPLGYADDATCGPLKAVNATPFESAIEDE
jgi:hypothetical protein